MCKTRPKFEAGYAILANQVLDQILPRHCVTCGLFSGKENICPPCKAELPRIRFACEQCGLPLPAATDKVCGACLKKQPAWDACISGLAYQFPVDQLVCRFKFNRNLAGGQILGMELLAAINQSDQPLPEVIIPVPLHQSRLFSRAFNQADMLARQLSRGLQIPVRPNLLSRTRRTRAQSGLDARERRINIKGAFACRQSRVRHAAIVDDVMTTGATLGECARILKRAGVKCISAWVAARAPAC
jgi:ComF family protein